MKLLSIDLDGTLLNDNHEITEKTIEILKKAKENGHEVVINTGRIIDDIKRNPEVLELGFPIISMNGTIIYNEEREILFETNISYEIYKKMFTELKKADVGILIYTNKGVFPESMGSIMKNGEEKAKEILSNFDYSTLDKIKDLKIYKMIAVAEKDQLHKLDNVRKTVANYPELTYGSSWIFNVEITSVEADKGLAIRRFPKLIGKEFDEIIAFGDNGNDLSQLKAADCAVVMENAPENIKEIADIITKTNNEDGVAYAIEHVLKLV